MESTLLPHPKLDFFRSCHRVYYFATGEFIQQSNGFRVPFYLCHILNELGFEAYVTAKKQAPNLRTPLLTPAIASKHKKDGREVVAVYTEAMWGNILGGGVAVRWILNRIGLLINESKYPNDLFFYWDNRYSKNKSVATQLKTCYIDPDIFYIDEDKDKKRHGFAYYAHKYIRDFRGDIPEDIKKCGISLCHDIPRTHCEIADILRNVKVLYCFEDSAIILEAVACGCIAVLLKTEFTSHIGEKTEYIDYVQNLEDFRKDNDFVYIGETYRNFSESIEETKSGIAGFILTTQQVKLTGTRKQDEFIKFIQEHEEIYIYGTGLTAEVVYNTVIAAGLSVNGFIVSDEYYSDRTKLVSGLPVVPLSGFIKINNEETGVITAMLHRHVEQVLPLLKKNGVHIYNPVLY